MPMTMTTTKHLAGGPLIDKTNILNMNSNKNNNLEVISKQNKGHLVNLDTPVKKSKRIVKKRIFPQVSVQNENIVTNDRENCVNGENIDSKNKHLIIKIPKIPTGKEADEEKNCNNVRLRRKSVFLDDRLYDINKMITKPFDKKRKVVANLHSIKKSGTLREPKGKSKKLKQLEGITKVSDANKNNTKKLVGNIEKMNPYENNDNTQVIEEMRNKKLKILLDKEEKATKETDKQDNPKANKGAAQLYIEIARIPNQDNRKEVDVQNEKLVIDDRENCVNGENISDSKNKDLIVKIPKILTCKEPVEEKYCNNVRLRTKSVLLDDRLYEIDKMIAKPIDKNTKVVASLHSSKKTGTSREPKGKSKKMEQLKGITKVSDTNKTSTKKLVGNIEKINTYENNDNIQEIEGMPNKKLTVLLNKEEKATKQIDKQDKSKAKMEAAKLYIEIARIPNHDDTKEVGVQNEKFVTGDRENCVNGKIISGSKNTELIVEIPKLPTGKEADEEKNCNNVRLRRKSVLLDDRLYEIDQMITKPFDTNSIVVASLHNSKKTGTLRELKGKSQNMEQLEGITKVNDTHKTSTKKLVGNIEIMNTYENSDNIQVIEGMPNKKLKVLLNKEEKVTKQIDKQDKPKAKMDAAQLYIEIARIPNHDDTKEVGVQNEKIVTGNRENCVNGKIISGSENTKLIVEIPKPPIGKEADEEKNFNNVRLRRKSVLLDDRLYEIDKLITKPFDTNSIVVASLHSSKKTETLRELKGKSKNMEQLGGITKVSDTNKTSTKKFVGNIEKINTYENNDNIQVIEEMPNKKLKVLLNKEIDKQDKPKANMEAAHNIVKLSKNVKFDKNLPKMKEIHNLRKLEPKNYEEESVLDNTQEGLNKPNIESDSQQLQKKDGIPIYRKQVPEEPKNSKVDDMYEFVDSSPKPKKIDKKRRPHRSSILFDKNTHEILKKIEEKEAKAKKKVVRRKKKLLAPVPEKSYEKIIEDIVSNVREKINEKNVDSCKQGENDVPLKDRHKKLIQLNNANNEMRIIVPCIEVPSIKGRTVPEVANEAKYNTDNVTTRRGENAQTAQSKNNLVNKETVTNIPHIDIVDDSMNAFNFSPNSPDHDDSISVCSDHDDSVVNQNDIDSCFGFDDDNNSPPAVSTPIQLTNKHSVNILAHVVLRRGNTDVESPVDFNYRRPNANSTMVHFRSPRRSSSPWRPDWVNVKRNPHYISVKNNALPRIDQEPVLEHSFVEEFESLCSKTPRKGSTTPVHKSPVQQSILDFVGSNIEKESDVVHRSLFDYEAFNSPEKKTRKEKENQRVLEVKRNVLGNNNIVSSTPIQRKVLGDISNSSGELIIGNSTEKDSLFGFNETTLGSPEPPKRNGQHFLENIENDPKSKPENPKRNGQNILENVENDPKSKPEKPKRNGQNILENVENDPKLKPERPKKNGQIILANDENDPKSKPEKPKRNGQNVLTNVENDPQSKPSRFDVNVLKSYTAKNRRKKVVIYEEPKVVDAPETSISLMEVSNEEENGGEVHLFEEPEEMFDNMSSVHIGTKKPRRKRLDSCDSDESNVGRKRKKHKKTKLEIEQEKWIAEFNQMCEEVDQYELELE